jgi:iron(III) transport system ATP-binding protein
VAEPYLKIENVTKRFGEFVALDDVSLDVAPGEFVCFLGPSGCGKTTLLRAIAGLDFQSEGRIHMNGRDVSDLPPVERDFGIVFQSYALFPNLNVVDNVAYGLRGKGNSKKEIRARVDELLATVGLPDQSTKYPAQLSGGQQQRVALARALATSPGLLLLDEPLSALDAKVRGRLRKEIKDLQHQLGVTTIMVTHDQEEALTMADRILVMLDGHVEQIGTPEAIYTRPASAFVADFIGEMNFAPADIEGEGMIRLGSARLRADTSGISGPKAIAAIRPEDILVQDVTEKTDNALNATVAEREYLGSFVRARLTGGDLGEHSLRADLSMNLVRRLDLADGASLPVALPPERIRVYAQDSR